MAEQWPDLRGKGTTTHLTRSGLGPAKVVDTEPHLCENRNGACPGPKLVAKLEAAEGSLRRISKMPCITELLGDDLGEECMCASCDAKHALSAWESASAPVETKAEEKMG